MAETLVRAQVMELLTAKWSPPVVGVLAELGVADHLADGPMTPAELAAVTGAHPGALRRVLRAAAGLGVFAEDEEGRFALTPMAGLLRADVPGSLRAAAMMFAAEPFWAPYAHIGHSVRTGEPAFDTIYGTGVGTYFAQHPETAALFGATAASFHAEGIAEIAAAHDFSGYGTVVDVGGGAGTLLATVLRENPAVHGVLFDLPDMIDRARAATTFDGVADRVEFVSGDFFEAVPAGDALLLKSCLHTLRDEEAVRVLRVIRRGLSPDAVLLVAETLVPAGNDPHYAKLDDVEMLVIAGGMDRQAGEYGALLTEGGFEVRRVTPCGDRFSLVEARPLPS